jgi:hypothetical protein
MTKVFAVILQKEELALKTWSSIKLFNKTDSWIDNKFIFIATSNDFIGNTSYPARPIFDDKISHSTTSFIARTQHEINAHNIMYKARNKHLGIL